MEISNDELARILGRMEAKLDAQGQSSLRQETALAALDEKLTTRLNKHEERLRVIEVVNPERLAATVQEHEQRIQSLEKGAAKAGMIAGLASSLGVAALVELFKHAGR